MRRIPLLLIAVITVCLCSCSGEGKLVILAAEEAEYNKCREIFPEIECIGNNIVP